MGSHLDRSQKNSDLSHQIFLAHITLPASLLSGLIALGAGFKEDDEDDGDKRLRLWRVSEQGLDWKVVPARGCGYLLRGPQLDKP